MVDLAPLEELHAARSPIGEPGPRIHTILLAVSTETLSNGALELAAALARDARADVVAFHVREWLFPGSEWVLGEGAFVEGVAAAGRLIELVMGRLASEGVNATTVIRGGRPGQVGPAIVAAAHRRHADLIVLGFHRHSIVEEILAGGVARKVRRLSDVPVLTVPRGPVARSKIVVVNEDRGRLRRVDTYAAKGSDRTDGA
jgi:nucleotide-binding universal stress UspA family protein